eukprot:CAMPEP_0168389024 /NCGR_PEP_ID=MMETSP0228-20121227/16752_1 /TAXON_ID=133427 /ORGANISM="Protoceratium reticulatum, Strain CCCM 535 (=CCMP 1889)" /LENGTH=143 /DNA_ID=CAMNT_0008402287 /DNA_START=153 /DNA_END=584 /DNA_ORIENTATION=+
MSTQKHAARLVGAGQSSESRGNGASDDNLLLLQPGAVEAVWNPLRQPDPRHRWPLRAASVHNTQLAQARGLAVREAHEPAVVLAGAAGPRHEGPLPTEGTGWQLVLLEGSRDQVHLRNPVKVRRTLLALHVYRHGRGEGEAAP